MTKKFIANTNCGQLYFEDTNQDGEIDFDSSGRSAPTNRFYLETNETIFGCPAPSDNALNSYEVDSLFRNSLKVAECNSDLPVRTAGHIFDLRYRLETMSENLIPNLRQSINTSDFSSLERAVDQLKRDIDYIESSFATLKNDSEQNGIVFFANAIQEIETNLEKAQGIANFISRLTENFNTPEQLNRFSSSFSAYESHKSETIPENLNLDANESTMLLTIFYNHAASIYVESAVAAFKDNQFDLMQDHLDKLTIILQDHAVIDNTLRTRANDLQTILDTKTNE